MVQYAIMWHITFHGFLGRFQKQGLHHDIGIPWVRRLHRFPGSDSCFWALFGVLGMLSSSMMPLGMLLFGPLSDVIMIEWLLIATGLVMVIQGFFLLGNKALIEAGRPAPMPEQ